ncbi:calcium-binding protein [Enterovibrio calviensis]|uniref:calcium-binding protein n=1 Tax=Enterovibrio calviensis TaxID=91359 RepID=UPI0037358EBE
MFKKGIIEKINVLQIRLSSLSFHPLQVKYQPQLCTFFTRSADSDHHDSLFGDNGNDVLLGGTGNDTLKGGTGNDFIAGGSGHDVLWGGTHADTFYFDGASGHDVIKDFNHRGQGDKLQIDDSLATNIGQISTWQNGANLELYFKASGDVIGQITLENFSSSQYGDDMFQFV